MCHVCPCHVQICALHAGQGVDVWADLTGTRNKLSWHFLPRSKWKRSRPFRQMCGNCRFVHLVSINACSRSKRALSYYMVSGSPVGRTPLSCVCIHLFVYAHIELHAVCGQFEASTQTSPSEFQEIYEVEVADRNGRVQSETNQVCLSLCPPDTAVVPT